MIAALAIGFVALVALGVPVAFALGIAASVGILYGAFPADVIVHRTVMGVDDFILIAVPMFILAGNIMERGDISRRLVDLAQALLSPFRGGLPNSMVLGEMFFSGISGSTAADIAAMSSMVVPALERRGYTRAYSLAIVSAASAFGILIPPCILMIVLAAMINSSVLAVFVGAVLPTLVFAALTMGLVYWKAGSGSGPVRERFDARRVGRALSECAWALGLPIIIFAGVVFGIATATEIAATAVLYAVFVSMVVYRKLGWRDLPALLVDTGVTTGALCLMFGFATIMSYLLALAQVPTTVAEWAAALTSSPTVILLVFAAVFIVMGSFLEGMPAALIFVPIVWPTARLFGIDPIHFQIVTVVSIGVGLFLPPTGLGLIIASQVGQERIERIAVAFLPFLAVLLVGIAVVVAVPWLSTAAPKLLGIRY